MTKKLNLKFLMLASLIVSSKAAKASDIEDFIFPDQETKTIAKGEKVTPLQSLEDGMIRFFAKKDQELIQSNLHENISKINQTQKDEKILLTLEIGLHPAVKLFRFVMFFLDEQLDAQSEAFQKFFDKDFLKKASDIFKKTALDQKTQPQVRFKAAEGAQNCGLRAIDAAPLFKSIFLDPSVGIEERKEALDLFCDCFCQDDDSASTYSHFIKIIAGKELSTVILGSHTDVQAKFIALEKIKKEVRKSALKDMGLSKDAIAPVLTPIVFDANTTVEHKQTALKYLDYFAHKYIPKVIQRLTDERLDIDQRFQYAIVLKSIQEETALNIIEKISHEANDPQIQLKAIEQLWQEKPKTNRRYKVIGTLKSIILDTNLDVNLRLDAIKKLRYDIRVYADEFQGEILEILRALQQSALNETQDQATVKKLAQAVIHKMNEDETVIFNFYKAFDQDISVDLYGKLRLLQAKQKIVHLYEDENPLTDCLTAAYHWWFETDEYTLRNVRDFKNLALDETVSLPVRQEAANELNKFGMIYAFTPAEKDVFLKLSPSFKTHFQDYIEALWNKDAKKND